MQLDWPGLQAELEDRLEITSRAVIVVILLDDPAEATQLGEQLRGVLPTESVLQIVSDEEQVHAELNRLNAARDGLLRTHRAVVFLCPDPEALRTLRRLTQDLTASIDLFVELKDMQTLDLPDLHRRLWEAHTRAYGELDLTGLIPHHSAATRIPMRDIWQDRELGPFQSTLRGGGEEDVPSPAQEESPLHMVLGEPGAGKSALLRWWALEATPESNKPCTLFIPLAHWVAQAETRLLPLQRYLERRVGFLLGEQSVELGPHLSKMRLLLDGLDEVPEAWQRARILDECEALVKAHPGLKLVVSGREWVETELSDSRRGLWALEQMQPLDWPRAMRLVRCVLSARITPATAESLTAVERLTGELMDHRDFGSLRTNPLMLTFVGLLTAFNRSIPASRVELYNDLVEMLIVSWRAVRSGVGRRMTRAEVLRVAASLGWAMVDRGVAGLTERQLLEVLAENDTMEADAEQRQNIARQRLEQLREDSALLLTSDGLWRFHHATIGELLAARAVMLSHRLLERLCDEILHFRFRQVMGFVVGLATIIEPRDEVLRSILEAVTGTPVDTANDAVTSSRRARMLSRDILKIYPALPEYWKVRMARHSVLGAVRPGFRMLNTVRAIQEDFGLSSRAAGDLVVDFLSGCGENVFWDIFRVEFQDKKSDITCTTWGNMATLVERWAASARPEVRALAWRTWVGTSAARAEQLARLEPEVERLWRVAPTGGRFWWRDDPARRPEPPPELTEVMARYFPSIQSTY